MVNRVLSDAEYTDVELVSKDINQHFFIFPQIMPRSIMTILNLPIELKQKIAMELRAKDYASFRESCLKISQDINSFSVLNSKVISASCSREYEGNIRKILLNQSVRMIMHRHKEECINDILENTCIVKSRSLNNIDLFISTVFSTRKMKMISGNDNPYPEWIKKSFILFKAELSKVVGSSKIIQRKNSSYISWLVGFSFKNELIDISQIETFFINLSHAFNQAHGAEKLLIAILADEIKSFWWSYIPRNLVKGDISESDRKIAGLFNFAAEVRRTLQEISEKIEV